MAIFIGIGIFVLLLAIFNYANLSTVQSVNKLKEAGIRKVVGSGKFNLFIRHISETAIYLSIALCLSVLLTLLFLPHLNHLLEKDISFALFLNLKVFLGLLITVLLVCILSGILPAIIVAKYNPVQILQNKAITQSAKFFNFRSTFVVSQFVISLLLIIGTLGVNQQLKFLQKKVLGFTRDNIIISSIEDPACTRQYKVLKEELLRNANVMDVTITSNMLNSVRWQTNIRWNGQPDDINNKLHVAYIDKNTLDFYNISIIEGAENIKHAGADKHAFILSQHAVDQFELENPIGMPVDISERGTVIGVMDNIYFNSLHLNRKPLAFKLFIGDEYEIDAQYLAIKVNQKKFAEAMQHIEKVMLQFSPNYPFNYANFDDKIVQTYKSEMIFRKIVSFFSVLALLIACLGLFGLANYNMQKKIKEIGVRKVNGAKIREVLAMLNVDMVKNLIIALIIATPLGWYALSKWLEAFAYRATIAWWIFALAGISAVLVALLTVSWQSWNAARKNPVEALRYE